MNNDFYNDNDKSLLSIFLSYDIIGINEIHSLVVQFTNRHRSYKLRLHEKQENIFFS